MSPCWSVDPRGVAGIMERLSLQRRFIVQAGRALVLLWAFSAVLGLHAGQLPDQESMQHPYIEQREIKSETCLTCHPEKKEGKFLHTALGLGCERCHRVTSENGKTTITPIATGGALCAMCHAVKKAAVLHGPYRDGQCLTCHEPHASQFRAQVRAPGNSLCLECHLARRPTNGQVRIFNKRDISGAEFEAIPKIKLDPTQRFGHPGPRHTVAERPDPLHPGERMACSSCHEPHASTLPRLIITAKQGIRICEACHLALEQQR